MHRCDTVEFIVCGVQHTRLEAKPCQVSVINPLSILLRFCYWRLGLGVKSKRIFVCRTDYEKLSEDNVTAADSPTL